MGAEKKLYEAHFPMTEQDWVDVAINLIMLANEDAAKCKMKEADVFVEKKDPELIEAFKKLGFRALSRTELPPHAPENGVAFGWRLADVKVERPIYH